MVKLTWANVRDQRFIAGVTRVFRHRLPYKISLDVLLLTKKIEEQKKLSDKMADKLDSQYFETNAEGKKVLKDSLAKEFDEAYASFCNTDFTVKVTSLPAAPEVLAGLELSAEDLHVLSPLLVLPEEDVPPAA